MKHFHSKIVGVTKKNDDGSNRQKLLPGCRPAMVLTLDHEEGNRFDPNAVRVLRPDGKQLGYLSAELAEEVVKKSKTGFRYQCFAKDLTGGGEGESYGMNILL